VASIGRQPRDRRDDRGIAELEFLADGRPVRIGGEPRQVDGAGDPEDPIVRNAHLAAPRLDHPGRREHRGGTAIERRAKPVTPDRSQIMEGPHHRRPASLSPLGSGQHREPVIVRMVRVHHINMLVAHERPQPQDVARQRARPPARVHVQTVDHLEPRLLRLGLETVSRDQPQQDAMAACAQTRDEVDDRIGAAGPPAVGGKMQNRQRRHEASDTSAATRAPTSAAEISRMHG
jgi:hypothetical protein